MRRYDPALLLLLAAVLFGAAAVCLHWPPLLITLVLLAILAGTTALTVHRAGKAGRAFQEQEAQMERERASAKAEKEALEEELRKRMEDFRSALSHELRMPVSIIQGYAELIVGGKVTEPEVQKEYLQKILQRTRNMSESLSRRLTDDRQKEFAPARRERLELTELARLCANDMTNAAAGRGISIQVLSHEPELWVYADRYHLGNIFFNLMENSIKYMKREGMVTIRISRQGDMAQVIVKDDGMGLAAPEVEHIFELYYQGSNRIPGNGHGHGLNLVKRVVEEQGGSITASSQPGQGMTVTFTLPMAREACPVS